MNIIMVATAALTAWPCTMRVNPPTHYRLLCASIPRRLQLPVAFATSCSRICLTSLTLCCVNNQLRVSQQMCSATLYSRLCLTSWTTNLCCRKVGVVNKFNPTPNVHQRQHLVKRCQLRAAFLKTCRTFANVGKTLKNINVMRARFLQR